MRNYYGGGLVLPKKFASVESEEIEYIEGGIYVSNSELTALIGNACVAASCMSIAAIEASIYGISAIIATTIPGFGWITGGILIANAGDFAIHALQALLEGKGLHIRLGWKCLSFSVE